MGARGPAKTPIAIKRARGTYQPCRDEGVELPAEMPQCPDGVPDEVRVQYERLVQSLAGMEIVAIPDGASLLMLAEYMALYWALRKDMTPERVVCVSPRTGASYVNPQFSAMNACAKTVIGLLRQFGMTPSARAGMKVQKDTDPDPLTDALQRRGSSN